MDFLYFDYSTVMIIKLLMEIYGAVLLHGEFLNIYMYECGAGVRWIT